MNGPASIARTVRRLFEAGLHRALAFFARRTLARYRPRVVAVAGSVGKTSTTRAVAAVLARAFRTRSPIKNYNNEIGVPLTILGQGAAGVSPFGWAAVFGRSAWLAFGPAQAYPEVLVLEMATDKPGDLDWLVALAPPDVSVLTAVSEEHTEFLGDLDGVAKEEGTIVRAARGTAVLNADDPRVAAMASDAVRPLLYGFAAHADVRAESTETEAAFGTVFTRFGLVIGGVRRPVNLPQAIGDGNVSAALAAAAVALALGVDPDVIPYGLAEYQPPPGRLRVLPGTDGLTLVDDTYNSSPRAAELALRTFRALPSGPGARRVAALADMLELGHLTEESHRRVGALAAESGLDLLIGVGPASERLCRAAREAGMPEERVLHVRDAAAAVAALDGRLGRGDLLLVKGSRGMRMERVVKALMAEPERARELLVGQGD